MKEISQEELNKILNDHKLWLEGKGDKYADLSYVNLSHTNLSHIDLRGANLAHTDLTGTDLSYTDLKHAKITNANLVHANLKYADLSDVNLRYADLSDADSRGANLSDADLRHTDLSDANLSDANLKDVKANIYTVGYHLACPEEGSFVGYKKADDCIVKLLILEDAKRSSATTIKCRCNKARVLEITDIETGKSVDSAYSDYDNDFIYKVGEVVYVDNFDNDRWNECSNGIHFFLNKENAIKY